MNIQGLCESRTLGNDLESQIASINPIGSKVNQLRRTFLALLNFLTRKPLCREILKEHHLIVGCFDRSGLYISVIDSDYESIGVAGMR